MVHWYVVVVLLVAALVIALHRVREPFDARHPSIFVSVASYRDRECSATINDLFAKADHPGRVFVGVCEQNSKDTAEACAPLALPRNVRRVSIPYSEARGPTYARYLCSTLYQGEAWYMQIDSHTRFVQGWDTKALHSVAACPSAKPVLTHYPRKVEEQEGGDLGVPVLCKSKFDGHGVPTFESVILQPPSDGTPRRVPFVSGGFVFMPGQAVRDVPYDPDLPHLFQGEEILHSARLWTAGYDFFTPLQNIVYHFYERKGAPKFWNDIKKFQAGQATTLRKVRQLLGLEQPPIQGYRYGMGSVRSLEDYWKFAGVDVEKKTSASHTKFCTPGK
jgi:[Skp1-protein]-hydroxyproline N-acetylglucosaminyltransferase